MLLHTAHTLPHARTRVDEGNDDDDAKEECVWGCPKKRSILDDLPEEEPAIEVIRTVQEASEKREKQAKAPFAAGSVFKESEPIPDDHALEVVVEADDANTSLGQTKKSE